ncbi:MAG: glycoside hydrolase family 15 protein [Rhodanobacteraceae bacterium]
MRRRIEDYALIANMRTAALVGRDGCIDWLCLPRFDSSAVCAALVGSRENGHWSIAPQSESCSAHRAYRDGTMVLETVFSTGEGEVALIDCLAMARDGGDVIDVVRVVEGRGGRVPMRMSAKFRFDYGRVRPRSMRREYGAEVVAGPNALQLRTSLGLTRKDDAWCADFSVGKGERVTFVLTWYDAWQAPPRHRDARRALRQTDKFWREWSRQYTRSHPWHDAVLRSLLTLKSLSDDRTGGIIAAPTLGLPEVPGGTKNYDYRYTWLRDATFTIYAMLHSGYHEEARKWRDWLVDTTAGDPARLQPLYRVDGARRIAQQELEHLSGFQDSRPVLLGNQAWRQIQMDGYGEVINGMHVAHQHGLHMQQDDFDQQLGMLEYLEHHWQHAGTGLWELGKHIGTYTHSQVMVWVAADRVARLIEDSTFEGDAARWRALADRIHAHVCENGFDVGRNTFLQRYGSRALDAVALRIPIVGFLPVDDPRMLGTIDAIQKQLCRDGFIWRYCDDDGELPAEGSFLVCSFWMVENLAMLGRRQEALEMFQRLLDVRNDVGLLSEEYDPAGKRLLGNFPQVFSHVGLVNAAHRLADDGSSTQAAG